MKPSDETFDLINSIPIDDDMQQNTPENDSSDLGLNFITDFGYDPFDDDDDVE